MNSGRLIFSAAFLAAMSMPLMAQGIDIKGVHIGMSQFELQDLHGQLPLENFTIAGVPSTNSYIDPDFLDGQLEKFDFFFESKSFDDVYVVVKKKFPALTCQESRVTTALGKALTQKQCTVSDRKGALFMVRYSGNLLTSALTLQSNREIKRAIQSRKAAGKDI
jgi:hypothetical protein